ncbi:tripartite motif-containing protein 2-like [Nothobranchius furzeri]|uniref:Tripartite motif-containing protein 2-like n=1 Tax=Nothobranchius furzeri TaxID=105023 RepID=A0A9D2Y704_NOTFU|nr:tripartite motif-containing protein 2-like [Nothobranchius furzeri]
MHLITPLSSSPTSPTPASSPNQDGQSNGSSPRQSPLCWAAQAERDLAQAKEELCRMQERHTTEIESVKRGVERAILGARREERRLLERVEQDHRDTQQRLEQIQKENMAAARKKATVSGIKQPFVARSLSMSEIDGSSQELNRSRGEREELVLQELDEEIDPSHIVFNPRDVHLIGQFGKQGSGRADLTLPSGIHATPQGQLFIVDCGNARVQVTDPHGNVLQQVASPNADCSTRRCRNYFDIAVNAKGLIALSCAAERALLVFNRHGRLLQTFGGSGFGSTKDELEAPRGVTVTRLDEFLVADIRKGTLIALKLEPKTGSRLERTVVTGFHRPYLVAACLSSGMVAVSERGNETGRLPCIKVLEPGWNTVRVLGVCAGMGPVLTSPWGICVDTDGNVLVADWGEQHRIIVYPAQGVGWPIISQGLSSPRGLTLLPEGQLAVSDSMHHCIKMYQYKADHSV